MKEPVRVAVTGAAGQIGYSLLFRLASGEVFGSDTPVQLHLVELPDAVKFAEGTAMELEDCGFKTLHKINIFDSAEKGFEGINWGLLVGSKPRGPGMERADLIRDNGHIFVGQGKALNKAASKPSSDYDKIVVLATCCEVHDYALHPVIECDCICDAHPLPQRYYDGAVYQAYRVIFIMVFLLRQPH